MNRFIARDHSLSRRYENDMNGSVTIAQSILVIEIILSTSHYVY